MARHVDPQRAPDVPGWVHVLGVLAVCAALFAAGSLLYLVRGAYAPTGHVPTAVAKTPAPALELPRASASPRPKPSPVPTQPHVYFHSCADAAEAKALPLRRGDAGYRIQLDSDRDGKACENYS